MDDRGDELALVDAVVAHERHGLDFLGVWLLLQAHDSVERELHAGVSHLDGQDRVDMHVRVRDRLDHYL